MVNGATKGRYSCMDLDTSQPRDSNMRLLDTNSLILKDFFEENAPKYAILSHRWGDEEVSYQDFLDTQGQNRTGSGWSKITHCCSFAKSRGLDWVWTDTCCIDKKSSAELSEAINSMFNWYKWSTECYAYLSDVTWVIPDKTWAFYTKDLTMEARRQFRDSQWFTRGWTLQELLAPERMLFLDEKWKVIGDKKDLLKEICDVTKIRPQYILGGQDGHPIDVASVAERMSWVSKRRTTRTEDMAYCMLGIFGVNMPLLYGERDKAFLRLQLGIIRHSDDESIFAWFAGKNDTSGLLYGVNGTHNSGLLATQPSGFAESRNIFNLGSKRNRQPYRMTNKGLEIRMDTVMTYRWGASECRDLQLNCWEGKGKEVDVSHGEPGTEVIIRLRKTREGWVRDHRRDQLILDGMKLTTLDSSFHAYVYQYGL